MIVALKGIVLWFHFLTAPKTSLFTWTMFGSSGIGGNGYGVSLWMCTRFLKRHASVFNSRKCFTHLVFRYSACSTFYETPKRITNEGNINERDDDHSTERNPYKQTQTPTVTRMTNEASIVRNPYKKDSWGKLPETISSSNSLIKKTVRDGTISGFPCFSLWAN